MLMTLQGVSEALFLESKDIKLVQRCGTKVWYKARNHDFVTY